MKIKITFSIFLMLWYGAVFSQVKTVSGTVTDNTGGGLPGVLVKVERTGAGTQTSLDGRYSIAVESGDVLIFTFAGMSDRREDVGQRTTIDVRMADKVLDEVMVVAYGTAKKGGFTGSAQAIGSEEIEKRSLTTITQAMEGKVTGVQTTSSSGQPGSSPSIRIRGIGTLNGSANPLIILDGVQYEGSIANIDPNDVESYTVLKDAAGTAIYGSRAANGVIVIVTKSGKKNGKISVSLNTTHGLVLPALVQHETVGPKDHFELTWDAVRNGDPSLSSSKVAESVFEELGINPFNVERTDVFDENGNVKPNVSVVGSNRDWYDELLQTAIQSTYNVSATGGGEKHDFAISMGYFNSDGYIIKSNFERINARAKANVELTDWMKIGTNISVGETDQQISNNSVSGSAFANPFRFVQRMAPIYPVYQTEEVTGELILDENGDPQYTDERVVNSGRNVVAEVKYNRRVYNRTLNSNRLYAEFTPVKNLKITINGATDIQNYILSSYRNPIIGDGAPDGDLTETKFKRTVYNLNQLISYKGKFKQINYDILLGHESFERTYKIGSVSRDGEVVKNLYEFTNFTVPNSSSGSLTEKATEGYFSRFNLDYQDKYYLSFSLRRDGSSVFHPDKRWGTFYALGGSWRVSKESFLSSVKWLDDLRLRASYGLVGNDNLDGDFYAFRALYGLYPNGTLSGIRLTDKGNDNLTWESSTSIDLGLEFALFDDKLSGTVEYYRKNSTDLLYNRPTPPSSGLYVEPANIASLYNQGVEITLTGELLKLGDFTWEMTLQGSTIDNAITEIPDPFVSGTKRWAVGHSVYDYYLRDFAGVDPRTGLALYNVWEEKEDDNGNIQIVPVMEGGKQKVVDNEQNAGFYYTGHSSLPDFFGSISNDFSYKNVSLSILTTYSIGGYSLDGTYQAMMHEGGAYGSSWHVDALNAWKKPGDQTDVPRLDVSYINGNPTSDRFLISRSYFAIRNINVSYTFGKKILNPIGIKSCKLSFTGENLFLVSAREGLNPQYGFNGTTDDVYKPARVYTLGLTLNF